MTPRQFHALSKRHQECREQEQKHLELLFAINTLHVVNSGFARPDPPAKLEQFLLRPLGPAAAADAGAPVSGESLRSMLRGLPAGFVRQG